MLNRRDFIQKSIYTAGALALAGPVTDALAATEVKLTILHTNDVHSRIDPMPLSNTKSSGLGGAARRATLIKKIRAEQQNVLLLDAGDSFQGTPYYNFFGGELEFKLMSQMGYDASTIGNHDFDNGIPGLEKNLPFANFPLLIANYDFKNNSLNGRFKPYKIFTKDGLKIGVFGLGIELEGLVTEKLHEKTVYNDPIASAKEMVQELRSKKCDLIICLSHLGYKYTNEKEKVSDIVLANSVSGIDLVIGGHTHTFLDQPVTIENKEGFKTLVNQVGWAGMNLGRLDFTFTPDKKVKKVQGSALAITEEYDRV